MRKSGDYVTISITAKGVVVGAEILFEMGFLSKKTLSRARWLYASGVPLENKEFQKIAHKVGAAACRAAGESPWQNPPRNT